MMATSFGAPPPPPMGGGCFGSKGPPAPGAPALRGKGAPSKGPAPSKGKPGGGLFGGGNSGGSWGGGGLFGSSSNGWDDSPPAAQKTGAQKPSWLLEETRFMNFGPRHSDQAPAWGPQANARALVALRHQANPPRDLTSPAPRPSEDPLVAQLLGGAIPAAPNPLGANSAT